MEKETQRKLSQRFAAVAARRRNLRGEPLPRAGESAPATAVDALGFAQAALGSDGVMQCPLSIARLFASAAAPSTHSDGTSQVSAAAVLSQRSYLALMQVRRINT